MRRWLVGAPARIVVASCDELMEARMRPVARRCDITVLNRVVMNVLDVSNIVALVADEMLPEPPLQYWLGRVMAPAKRADKIALDCHPSTREIAIAFGQSPDAVDMFGQDDLRIYRKRPTRLNRSDRGLQQRDILRLGNYLTPPMGDDGEEVNSARNMHSSVAHHLSMRCERSSENWVITVGRSKPAPIAVASLR